MNMHRHDMKWRVRQAVGVFTTNALIVAGVILAMPGSASAVTAPTQLAIGTAPSTGEITGVALPIQPIILVEDSSGNVVTTVSTGTVTATAGTGCTVSAGGTASISSGRAVFSGLTMTATSGTTCAITFTDTTDGYTQVSSSSILISDVPSKLFITTAPSSSVFSGSPFSTQPVISVEDSSGTVVKVDSSVVTATVTAPAGSATLQNATATASAGVATFSGLTLNALSGSYTLTFSDGGLATATSGSITVNTGAAAKLAVVVQPSSTTLSGAVLAQQPQIVIEDSGGNRVTTNASTVTATMTSGGGTVTNNFATASAGIATFSGMALNALVGSYTLTFTDGSLVATVSSAVTVGVGAATQLAINRQPSTSVSAGAPLAVQPIIWIEDSGGNRVTSNYSTVTATITSSSYTLSYATAAAVAGAATFTNLSLNAPIGTYTLTFSDSPLTSVVSTPVTVSSGLATHLVVTTQPSATASSGVVLAQVPVVKVEDASGNVVTSDSSLIVAKFTTGGKSITANVQTAVAGVATFNAMALNALVGTYTITFTDGTLSPATSTSVTVLTGPATQLLVTTEPSAVAQSGVALATQPVITAYDSGGNIATSVNSGVVTAGIVSGAGGALSAGTTAAFVLGRAVFSGLTLTGTNGVTYGLIYSGAGLSVVDSGHVTIGTSQAPLTITSLKGWHGRNLALVTKGGSGTGTLSFVVVGGTNTGCRISGSVLIYSGVGTCIVVATKAGDATYQAVSSAPTVITISRLPIPRPYAFALSLGSAALSARTQHDLILLSRQLTAASVVKVYGFAPGNLRLARLRAQTVVNFLRLRVKAHYTVVTQTATRLQEVRVVTVSQ